MNELIDNIVTGDCIELLRGREEFVDLVFADPPFNIGYQYDRYKDKVKKDKYISWSRDWIGACEDVLRPGGSFYIAIGDGYAADIKRAAEEAGLIMRNWIIWHYTFGQQTKSKFARAHTHIFYFVKGGTDFVFNDFAVRVPSDRQLLYNDKRANPRGKMPDDVWNSYPRVCGTFKEREGWHPCQMPLLLLARIVSVSSNPGQVVLDPFIGSGTTACAAKLLERRYCGFDISKNYVRNAKKRLAEIDKNNDAGLFKIDHRESLELSRLIAEVNIDRKKILESEKLLRILAGQFEVRMNHKRKYDIEFISSALRESAG
jgi:site-specific DNA-methyltransferase (adenine-specific)